MKITQKCDDCERILKNKCGYAILELSINGGVMMKSDITDRMKKNMEIGRIAMLQLRCGMEISDHFRLDSLFNLLLAFHNDILLSFNNRDLTWFRIFLLHLHVHGQRTASATSKPPYPWSSPGES